MLPCQVHKPVLYLFLPATKWQKEPDKDFGSELSGEAQKPSGGRVGLVGGRGLLLLCHALDAKVRVSGALDPHTSSLTSASCPEFTLKQETLGEREGG